MASISSSAASARGGQRRVAGLEHLAHALEVLVDPDAHHLDLEAELLQLGDVTLARRLGAS